MASYPVKWFASQMQGATTLGDTTDGALVSMLKACLVTGFGVLAVNTIEWDETTGWAKATISGGHAYLQDSIVEVSGVSPAAYNGEHRVMKVTGTQVWFELDNGDPGSVGSGTMSMKVAPLGWTQTHESPDGKVAIFRPTDITASGNVSLRIDNTAFTGWTGSSNGFVAKVAMVEDVVDISTYTTIYEHRWPAVGRYSDKRWDLIGDSQLFYFMPAYGAANYQFCYVWGYLKSVRPGDRYHCVMNSYPTTNLADTGRVWSNGFAANSSYGNTFPNFDVTTTLTMARAYHQLFGTTGWFMKGIFTRFGIGMNVPNAVDNGFYLSTEATMVMETGSHVRGYLVGIVCPYGTIAAWDRKNFRDLPAIPGKITRFLRLGYTESQATAGQLTMLGFDLTGPWR